MTRTEAVRREEILQHRKRHAQKEQQGRRGISMFQILKPERREVWLEPSETGGVENDSAKLKTITSKEDPMGCVGLDGAWKNIPRALTDSFKRGSGTSASHNPLCIQKSPPACRYLTFSLTLGLGL